MKTFKPSDAIGQAGEYLVGAVVAYEFGWPYRFQSIADLGIDGEIEVLDEDGTSTGCVIKVQVKSENVGQSDAPNKKAEPTKKYVYPKEYEYWKLLALPVIICRPVLATREVFWMNASEGRRTDKMVVYDFSNAKRLERVHADSLRDMAKGGKDLDIFLGMAQSILEETRYVLSLSPIVVLNDAIEYARCEKLHERVGRVVAAIETIKELFPSLDSPNGRRALAELKSCSGDLQRLKVHMTRIE